MASGSTIDGGGAISISPSRVQETGCGTDHAYVGDMGRRRYCRYQVALPRAAHTSRRKIRDRASCAESPFGRSDLPTDGVGRSTQLRMPTRYCGPAGAERKRAMIRQKL